MPEYLILLDPSTERFYRRVADAAGVRTEQVLSDALFRLAGELSFEALAAQGLEQVVFVPEKRAADLNKNVGQTRF